MLLILGILRQQAKRYPFQYTALIILVMLAAAMWIAEPLYSRYAIDEMLKVRDGGSPDFVKLFAGWAALFVLISIIQTAQKMAGWKATETLILDYREKVYTHVLNLGVSFHTKQKSGEVVKILDNAADTLADLQRELVIQLVPSFLSAGAFLIIGFLIHPLMAAILVGSIVCYLCIALFSTKRTMKLQQQVNKLWVESIGRAYDAVTNIFSVKSGAQEESELNRMKKIHRETFIKQQQVNRKWAAMEAINFFMLTRMLLVAIGIYLYARGEVTLGLVYFFQTSFFRVLTPFEMLGSILPQWNKQVGRVKLAEELLATPIDIRHSADGIIPDGFKGEICFEHVSFAYNPEKVLEDADEHSAPPALPPETEQMDEDGDHIDAELPARQDEEDKPGPTDAGLHNSDIREVLRDISFSVLPGEHIALVGHSGAGKSTLAMLLNRFYDVSSGRILVDGTDMRELDVHWWRSNIGLVLQDNLMFNDSILENIRYARPDASEEEVKEAARRAAADDFIMDMPMGYATLIGDRGIRLSGGQRQRVAIARAILKQPKIVVLDEATSALDSVTERRVQDGIRELIKGRTSFIIAHRLSTVRSVDRIAVIEEGKLTAIAPHEELLKVSPTYKQMVELQHEGLLAE